MSVSLVNVLSKRRVVVALLASHLLLFPLLGQLVFVNLKLRLFGQQLGHESVEFSYRQTSVSRRGHKFYVGAIGYFGDVRLSRQSGTNVTQLGPDVQAASVQKQKPFLQRQLPHVLLCTCGGKYLCSP